MLGLCITTDRSQVVRHLYVIHIHNKMGRKPKKKPGLCMKSYLVNSSHHQKAISNDNEGGGASRECHWSQTLPLFLLRMEGLHSVQGCRFMTWAASTPAMVESCSLTEKHCRTSELHHSCEAAPHHMQSI